jgi:hypothetical protein
MNCAVVTINGTGGSGLDALPDMFVANIGDGCESNAEGTGVLAFPNPGDDLTDNSGGQSSPPTGANCQKAVSGGSGGSGGSAGNATATATGSAGSGATGGAGGAATTQTFNDGQYHPPTTTAVGASEATSTAATDAVTTSAAAAPTDSASAATEGDAYNIVMVIDGTTQSGMAYLTKPTAAAARHRYHRRAHKFKA